MNNVESDEVLKKLFLNSPLNLGKFTKKGRFRLEDNKVPNYIIPNVDGFEVILFPMPLLSENPEI